MWLLAAAVSALRRAAAPSLIPRRPGVRIKTDRLDARNLALALRAGTLTSVHIPSPEQEAFRDVVRAWQQSKRDVSAAKQRLKALLASAPLHGVARLRPKRALLRSFAPPGPDHTQRHWARTLLVEAAWSYRYAPKVSPIIEQRAQQLDPHIRALAWKAQLRLTRKYRRLTARGTHVNLVVTAVARELAGFI